MPRKRKPLDQKFADNTCVEGKCLVWTGKRDRKGYGLISLERQRWTFAHRAAWYLAHGEWPAGVVMHACDNPSCVLLDHLTVGTSADNLYDAIQKGRLDNRGSRHGMSKLTEDDVRKIKELRRAGHTQAAIGRIFGVGQAMVSMICSGKNWGHV